MEIGVDVKIRNDRTGEVEKAIISNVYSSSRKEFADVVTDSGDKISAVTSKDFIQ